jgi:hypothetical protein
VANEDFDVLYSPTLYRLGLRIFLSVVDSLDLLLHLVDICTALLCGDLDKEIYIESLIVSQGGKHYGNAKNLNLVCKL